jgi:predicted RecB family nuclease
MKITNDILRNSFFCDFKVKHLWNTNVPKEGILKQIEYNNNILVNKYISQKRIQFKELLITDATNLIYSGFFKVTYTDEENHFNYPLIEFSNKGKKWENTTFFFFLEQDKILTEDVKYYKELSLFLTQKLSIEKAKCSLIYGFKMKVRNIRLPKVIEKITLSKRIRIIVDNDKLKPSRIKHCSFCELNNYCRQRLVDDNSLKLLRNISEKEISKFNSKGIFTINQLSYNFKPRRRKRLSNSKGRYLFELKALSLRDMKTHVLNKRELPKVDNEIFIDFEGNLNYSVYLIGVVHKRGKGITKHYFWSKTSNDKSIFSDFFKFIFELNGSFCLFHYGSYETKAMRKINKLHSLIGDNELMFLEVNSFNLLDCFYSDVFPPTYSNGLKEIANYLGFKWSRTSANGILVTYWRNNWILNPKEKTKRKIIIYNIEDCLALINMKKWLDNIFEGNVKLKDVISDTKRHLKSKSTLRYGRTKFLIDEYQIVNKLAYFNYQREKVIIRDKNFKSNYSPKKLTPKFINKINSHEHPIRPICCERCGSFKLHAHQNQPREIIDLKINPTGIKRNCILFHLRRFRCQECKHAFTPRNSIHRSKYGFHLKIWVINQIISYRMSYGNIKKLLLEYFQISIAVTYLIRIRKEFSDLYSELLDGLKKELINGSLIQGDETKINLRSESGYIWVLTNLNTVIYMYQPNREGIFLHKLLKDFKGVIVSDFYTVYDSIGGSQQKCLIHLIRDINDDLFQNQLNVDLRFVAQEFGVLIKRIVLTIDKYGLKRRNLNKHIKGVHKFYRNLKSRKWETEIGKKWLKRLLKNEDSLFTFLQHDGVPWNNNNAEHAIKSFAFIRREINGFYNRKGIEELLVILSISETCKYRGISFWEFLKSKRMKLD